MTLKDIAIKNLLRRKSKTAFIVAGLVIGVATVVAVISFVDASTRDINHKLEKYGANILITPRTDHLTLSYGGLSLGGVSFEMKEIRETDLAKVKSIKNYRNIAALGPLVLGGVEIKDRRVLLAGVDLKAARILKPWWRISGRLPGEGEVLAGAKAAHIVAMHTGDRLTVNGHELTVSGILEPTGSQDDQLVFTRLGTAQKLLQKEGLVSMVEVAALCTACPIGDMVDQISAVLPQAKVMAIQQVVKGRMETLVQFRKFSYVVSAVVVLIGGLVVLITLMGSVKERTEEIGIFRAIGFRRRHVMTIVMMEAAIASALAGVCGYLLGLGGTQIGFRFFSDSQTIAVPFNPELGGMAMVMAMGVGLVASAYPAMMAAKMDPNEALKSL
jgi:putative ABC transport system permease protein